MTNGDQIRDEKLQLDIIRGVPTISALSSNKSVSMNILLLKKYYHLISNK